jgi:hypothetical protein
VRRDCVHADIYYRPEVHPALPQQRLEDAHPSPDADGPQYIDTSLPPPTQWAPTYIGQPSSSVSGAEALEVQSRIDAILATGATAAQDVPMLCTSPIVSIPRNQRGPNDKVWYIGYYDPDFNRNPWEYLEMVNGLKPLGHWPEDSGRNKKH